jgi:hypothetical protein
VTIDAYTLTSETGATWRQLSHWARRGWLKSEGPTGTGHPLRFSEREAAIARIAVELVTSLSMHPQTACHYARMTVMGTQPRTVVELPTHGRLIIWQARAEAPQAPKSGQ